MMPPAKDEELGNVEDPKTSGVAGTDPAAADETTDDGLRRRKLLTCVVGAIVVLAVVGAVGGFFCTRL